MLRFAIAAILALTSPALAQMPGELARAEIDAGWRDGKTHVAGLTIRLAPGWKTYWRAPGDAGIPPTFNWSGSRNVADVSVQFPVPQVFDQNGMQSLGYDETVTFPLRIAVRDSNAPVRLQGEIDIGVCEEICVPLRLKVLASLPVDGNQGAALAALLNDRPETGGRLSCEIAPISDGLRLSAEVAVPRMGQGMVAVIETSNPEVWVSQPSIRRQGDMVRAEVEMVAPSARPFALARSDIRMTVIAGGRAVEMIGCN
ncbi:MAG: hypothetical protein HKN18_08800 [Silicimonas sp.]|nr:hypothetical protein [Silicimonas sp.]